MADAVSRFHRRRVKAWLLRLKPLLIVGGVAGVLGFAAYVVLYSSWLGVDRVEVAGLDTVSDERVIEAAGIDLQTPLARVDLDEVDGRVSALAPVADVTVHRSWPHTLTISVTERQPVATVQQRGQWWLFDGEGVLFRTTPLRDQELALVDFSGVPDETALREIAGVINALPDDLREQTRRITAQSRDSITLILRDGREVVWGSAAESERKGEVLAVLLSRKANSYDVSVPEQPTTTR